MKLIGQMVEKCPNLLNPLFESENWTEVADSFQQNEHLSFYAETFGSLILRCPQLLTKSPEELQESHKAIYLNANKIETSLVWFRKGELRKMITTDPRLIFWIYCKMTPLGASQVSTVKFNALQVFHVNCSYFLHRELKFCWFISFFRFIVS